MLGCSGSEASVLVNALLPIGEWLLGLSLGTGHILEDRCLSLPDFKQYTEALALRPAKKLPVAVDNKGIM